MKCLFALFILTTTTVSAQTTDPRLERILQRFPDADTNQDGKLTRDEANAYRALMKEKKSEGSSRGEPKSPAKRYTESELAEIFEAREFNGLLYRFFAPETNGEEKYPLILSLHGAGGKGTNNRKNLKFWNGIVTEPEFQKEHPCFVVAPQSDGAWRVKGSEPELTDELIGTFSETWQQVISRRRGFAEANTGGNLQTVFQLLDHLAETCPVDTDRVYVLGHSMGGFGSFECLAMEPERFAAAIPSAGGLSPWHDPESFKHVPVWAFHGDQDRTVVPELTEVVFNRMKEIKGNMKFTLLGGVGHGANAFAFIYEGDSMAPGFKTAVSSADCDPAENIWDWLFAKKRKR